MMLALPIALGLFLQPPSPPPPPPPPPPTATAVLASPGGNDLAAEAPMPEWRFEGGGKAGPADADPHEANKKIRRAAVTTITGGSIAVLGLGAAIAGGVIYSMQPSTQLEKLRTENGGTLPPDDPKRQRLIAMSRAAPIVTGVGVGVFVAGAITAAIAGRRLKKLREKRRTSTVAFGAFPTWGGASFSAEVRF